MDSFIVTASVWVLPVLLAVVLHEVAHGYVAWLLGDDTARRMGRLSLNPLRHVDPYGTVFLPLFLLVVQKFILNVTTPFLFGFAKPVPVNFSRLRHPRRDMIWVALAGPAINMMLAFLCALLMHVTLYMEETLFRAWLAHTLYNAVVMNIALAVFNMLPIPPLDGGRVLMGLLPIRPALWLARLERYGILIIFGLLIVLPILGEKLGFQANFLLYLLEVFVDFVLRIVQFISGWPVS